MTKEKCTAIRLAPAPPLPLSTRPADGTSECFRLSVVHGISLAGRYSLTSRVIRIRSFPRSSSPTRDAARRRAVSRLDARKIRMSGFLERFRPCDGLEWRGWRSGRTLEPVEVPGGKWPPTMMPTDNGGPIGWCFRCACIYRGSIVSREENQHFLYLLLDLSIISDRQRGAGRGTGKRGLGVGKERTCAGGGGREGAGRGGGRVGGRGDYRLSFHSLFFFLFSFLFYMSSMKRGDEEATSLGDP